MYVYSSCLCFGNRSSSHDQVVNEEERAFKILNLVISPLSTGLDSVYSRAVADSAARAAELSARIAEQNALISQANSIAIAGLVLASLVAAALIAIGVALLVTKRTGASQAPTKV